VGDRCPVISAWWVLNMVFDWWLGYVWRVVLGVLFLINLLICLIVVLEAATHTGTTLHSISVASPVAFSN
jgi:hypothetical protein